MSAASFEFTGFGPVVVGWVVVGGVVVLAALVAVVVGAGVVVVVGALLVDKDPLADDFFVLLPQPTATSDSPAATTKVPRKKALIWPSVVSAPALAVGHVPEGR
jgi:hypothetical protein